MFVDNKPYYYILNDNFIDSVGDFPNNALPEISLLSCVLSHTLFCAQTFHKFLCYGWSLSTLVIDKLSFSLYSGILNSSRTWELSTIAYHYRGRESFQVRIWYIENNSIGLKSVHVYVCTLHQGFCIIDGQNTSTFDIYTHCCIRVLSIFVTPSTR